MNIGKWPTRPIGELCSHVIDCVNKTAPTVDFPTPYKMLRTTNIRNGRVDTSSTRFVEKEIYLKWIRRGAPVEGDIILTREAPLGEIGLLRGNESVFLGQRLVMYRADRTVADNRFIQYALMSPWVQAEIQSLGSGSTVEHMRVPDCERLSLPAPPLGQQVAIGAALGAFDDLIENNRRRIEILEEMARLLYREWFVRFRFPGHESVKLVDSELGPIPERWTVDSLSSFCTHRKQNLTPNKFETEKFLHYSIPALDKNRLPSLDPGETIKSGKYQVTEDCVLLSKLNPRFPRVWRSPGPYSHRAVCSTEFLVLETSPGGWPLDFVQALVQNSDLGPRLAQMAGGTSTSHQRVRPGDVMSLPIVAPVTDMVEDFSNRMRPSHELVLNLIKQNRVLREARDLLLPRLVSGELDVSELNLEGVLT